MRPDPGGGGDGASIEHRIAGNAAHRIEADGVEGFALNAPWHGCARDPGQFGDGIGHLALPAATEANMHRVDQILDRHCHELGTGHW